MFIVTVGGVDVRIDSPHEVLSLIDVVVDTSAPLGSGIAGRDGFGQGGGPNTIGPFTLPTRDLSLKAIHSMTDDEAHEHLKLLRWPEGVTCPHCANKDRIYWLKTVYRWKCGSCRKQFSVTSGTIFAYHKLSLQEYLAAIALYTNGAKGLPMLQLSRDLDVQYKTAFVLCHKIREAVANHQDAKHSADAGKSALRSPISVRWCGYWQRGRRQGAPTISTQTDRTSMTTADIVDAIRLRITELEHEIVHLRSAEKALMAAQSQPIRAPVAAHSVIKKESMASHRPAVKVEHSISARQEGEEMITELTRLMRRLPEYERLQPRLAELIEKTMRDMLTLEPTVNSPTPMKNNDKAGTHVRQRGPYVR